MSGNPAPTEPPFFRPEETTEYERKPGTPFLLRRGRALPEQVLGPEIARSWAEKQEMFIRWTRDQAMFNEADVRLNYEICARYFRRYGPLRGGVLDIGGGWGLFREWWNGEGCFVVYDPGVERFTLTPPPVTRRFFQEGLSRPALFVEGFGEHLPYVEGSYDTVLIAAALDHCADPAQVLKEAARVLRPGGMLLLIQGFESEPGTPAAQAVRLPARLARVLSDPRRLYRAIRVRLFHRGEPHLYHFSRDELRSMVEAAGLRDYKVILLDEKYNIAAVEAKKPD